VTRSGGRILVDQLELNGADLAFCLPGESFLPLIDAFLTAGFSALGFDVEDAIACAREQGLDLPMISEPPSHGESS
jgi:thiamine pyrophosphate-dependent acetolactate synthase large subunit-like protein